MKVGEVRYPALNDADQLRAMALTMTDAEIATVVGCATESVRTARWRFKVPKHGDATYRTTERIEALTDYETLQAMADTMTDGQIAKQVGCTLMSVYRWRHRLGVTRGENRKPTVEGELPVLRETAVMLTCPQCRWTHSTMAAAINGAWQIDFDSKLRQEGRRVYHVPCGSAMRIYLANEQRQEVHHGRSA